MNVPDGVSANASHKNKTLFGKDHFGDHGQPLIVVIVGEYLRVFTHECIREWAQKAGIQYGRAKRMYFDLGQQDYEEIASRQKEDGKTVETVPVRSLFLSNLPVRDDDGSPAAETRKSRSRTSS